MKRITLTCRKALTVAMAAVTLAMSTNSVFAIENTAVSNKADFSTDTIYQIVTDRFHDGNAANNGNTDVFDKNDPKKYHGGDWAGIIKKLEDGYLTNLGVSAIWISSPVENIDTIDPSNGSAAYHGYWQRIFSKQTVTLEQWRILKSSFRWHMAKTLK